MAKKNQNDVTMLGVCHVTRSKEEMKALFEKQLEKGKGIYDKFPGDITMRDMYGRAAYNEQTSHDFYKEYHAWSAFCEEIYSSSFDDPNTKYLKDFKDAGQVIGIFRDANDLYQQSKRNLLRQIEEIECFIERLDIIIYP